MATVLFLLLISTFAGLVYFAVKYLVFRNKSEKRNSEYQSQKNKYEHDLDILKKYAISLKEKVQQLSKYEKIVDADAKASEILQSANVSLNNAENKATHIAEDANRKAAEIIHLANNTLSSAKNEAGTILNMASVKAAEITEEANKKAEEIAGDAYEVKKNASFYERAVKAMKNVIEGYGDQYLIPPRSLLDDLAEDFSHTQAGQELKKARELVTLMVRNKTAAVCDYVESNRRDTAIDFVIDAFNGKVDSILSRVRHDNAGTLEQKIRDAFTLVNLNGKAFRNACITEDYLAARLQELKWSAVVQQLSMDEREEQRRIKEQIREEEKARKEYERAMRDAAKEEDFLKKAMEKAQQQIDLASTEQKAKYEQQLQELNEKLKQAEERNQRALSMAQQTKRGHVYVISNVGSFGENVYKIGLTRRLEPIDRIRELGDASVPFEFDVHAMIFSEDAPLLETQLHKHFVLLQMNKVNHRKEFFRVDIAHIREETEKLGLNVKWTMTAEAREYHESLATEKAMSENPAIRENWIKRQLRLEITNDV